MKAIRKTIYLFEKTGFTLVELMVVVAIIGILSAVAIPNFKRYQAKTKTSEAKLQLAAIYSAEVAFQADSDWFATCLASMGYDPSNEVDNRYYMVGFQSGVGASYSDINGVKCVDGDGISFPAGKTVGGTKVTSLATAYTADSSDGSSFTAGAEGSISPDTNNDEWSIDENKKLMHVNTGY